MRFFILDPSLYDEGGHNLDYARIVAREAAESGFIPVVYGNVASNVSGEFVVVPHFRNGLREGPSVSTRLMASFHHRLRKFFTSLPHYEPLLTRARMVVEDASKLIAKACPNPQEPLFFPTLTWCDAALLCRFSVERPELNIHIVLRFDPPAEGGGREIFRTAALLGVGVTFWADTPELALVYGELFGIKVDLIRMPFEYGVSENSHELPLVSYFGEAREEKGFSELPEILESVDRKKIRCNFFIQILDDPSKSKIIAEAINNIKNYKSNNVNLYIGPLKTNEYLKYFYKSNVILCMHAPDMYKYRSAGIITQSAMAGIPVVMRCGESAPLAMLRRNGLLHLANFTDGTPDDTSRAIEIAVGLTRAGNNRLDCVHDWGAPWDSDVSGLS